MGDPLDDTDGHQAFVCTWGQKLIVAGPTAEKVSIGFDVNFTVFVLDTESFAVEAFQDAADFDRDGARSCAGRLRDLDAPLHGRPRLLESAYLPLGPLIWRSFGLRCSS